MRRLRFHSRPREQKAVFRHVRAFLLFWLCAAATHASGLVQPMHCDYSTWVRVTRDWDEGKTLYVETYDNKQPTLFLFVRLIDSSRPAVSQYVAETLLAALGALVLRAALLQTLPAVANLVPVLVIVWSGTSETFAGGQTTEAIALWLDVAGLSMGVLAARRASAPLAAAAGLLFFLAVSFRIPCAMHAVAYLPPLWMAASRHTRRAAARLSAALVGGVVGGFLLVYWHAQAGGYWSAFVEVFQRNLQYGALQLGSLPGSLLEGGKVLLRLGIDNTAAVVLVAITLMVVVPAWRRLGESERLWLAIGTLWMIAAVVGAFPGGRHYPHYYHVLWAPWGLLAALWVPGLQRLRGGWSPAIARRVVSAVLAAVVLMAIAENAYEVGKWLSGGRERTVRIERVAEELRRRTDADAPLPMYVWLDWAELYWRVPRPAVKWSVPQVLPDEMLDRWAEGVLKTRPPMIVYDASFEAREAESPHLERLREVLRRDYQVICRADDLRVVARRDRVDPR
jgi:hypothetical protein